MKKVFILIAILLASVPNTAKAQAKKPMNIIFIYVMITGMIIWVLPMPYLACKHRVWIAWLTCRFI